MSVAPPQGVAHVQPAVALWGGVGVSGTGLQDELVVVAVLTDEAHVLLQRLLIGDEDVGCLTQGVLAAGGSVDG